MKIKSPITKTRAHKIKCGVASLSSRVLGDAHFMLKSMADITVRTEASISHKLTGRSKKHVIEDRHNKTEETQQYWKDAAKSAKQIFNRALESMDSDEAQVL